jgi:hypothetical protein
LERGLVVVFVVSCDDKNMLEARGLEEEKFFVGGLVWVSNIPKQGEDGRKNRNGGPGKGVAGCDFFEFEVNV